MVQKKVETKNIDDLLCLQNEYFTNETNYYLRSLLFNLRLVFRFNSGNPEGLVELYDYIESIMYNEIIVDKEELQILIYRITDTVLNIDDINLKGDIIIIEIASNVLSSLYREFMDIKIHEKISEDEEKWSECLESQLINRDSELKKLADILELDDIDELKTEILNLLKNNYQLEYSIREARKEFDEKSL